MRRVGQTHLRADTRPVGCLGYVYCAEQAPPAPPFRHPSSERGSMSKTTRKQVGFTQKQQVLDSIAEESPHSNARTFDTSTWGLIKKLWAPFGPLDYKEYSIIQTPKGPMIFDQPPLAGKAPSATHRSWQTSGNVKSGARAPKDY